MPYCQREDDKERGPASVVTQSGRSQGEMPNVSSSARASQRLTRLVDVRAVDWITPRMKRVRLGGESLRGFAPTVPAQWVKLFVPVDEGMAETGRVYTITNFSPERCEFVLDFVVHGDGPASSWAQKASIGERVKIAGPRAGYTRRADSRWVLLFGDETAIPAISSILASLPSDIYARSFIEVAEPSDDRAFSSNYRWPFSHLVWLHRGNTAAGTSRLLAEAAGAAELPPGPGEVWVAAEAHAVQEIKKHFLEERGLSRFRVHASGYWKYGVPDHRNV